MAKRYSSTRRVRGAGLWLKLFLTKLPRGMTKEHAAQRLGVRPAILEEWINGSTDVPLSKLPAIADVAGIDLGVLLRRWIEGRLPAHARVVQRLSAHILSAEEATLVRVAHDQIEWSSQARSD